MNQRRIIIGDVHGHYDTLLRLLETVAPGSEAQIYFLGDLVDRGPKSAQVVEFVMQNNYACILGNHEEMMINVLGDGTAIDPDLFQAWLRSGGITTVESYNHNISQRHMNWLKSLPTYIDLGDIWLVHAGVDPKLNLNQQNSAQFCWIREDFHSSKQPYFRNKLIITGHTITFTLPGVKPGCLASGIGWLDIDTGAYHKNSGWLTALDVDNNTVYQANTMQKLVRKLPMTKAVTRINPDKIVPRNSAKKSYIRALF